MTITPRLDFAAATQRTFASRSTWFMRPIALLSATQHEDVLTIQVGFEPEDDRRYGAIFRVPAKTGDAEWTKWFDPMFEPDATIDDWVQWGVIQRLVEAYETRSETRLSHEDGVWWFDFRD